MTLNAKKRPKPPTTTLPGPPEWRHWDGKSPLKARFIAQEATRLFKKCGYNNFKFSKVIDTEQREIFGTKRYKVVYIAQRCDIAQKPKPCKKGKKKSKQEVDIKFLKCYSDYRLFQAIFRNNIIHSSLRLNVTNLQNDNSCALVIKYNPH
uniref:Uncharacterized protein n=1 Tax=Strongyloides venezuelensis TaxID=75913 RepID=A0A0K0FZJ7_STRVS